MLKNVLFTHNDLDGAGCRIIYELFRTANGEVKGIDFDVIICSNANVDDKVLEFLNRENQHDFHTEIWFADIVCSRENMSDLVCLFKTVKVFDHHATNFPIQQELPSAVIIPETPLGKKESGTSLLYQHAVEYAYNNPDSGWAKFLFRDNETHTTEKFIDKLVDNIRSYDTFEFKETKNVLAKKLQMFYLFIGMDQFAERYVSRITSGKIADDIILADGDLSYVINEKIANEQRIIDRITPDDVLTFTLVRNKTEYKAAFGFPVYGANVSELAYQFLRKYPEYDIYIQFSLSNNMEFSFRTAREDFDCGQFAVTYGGGGHPKASGSPLPENVRDAIITKLVEYLKYPNIDVAVLM